MNFEKGQKVRLVAQARKHLASRDGEFCLDFNGRIQSVATGIVEYSRKGLIVCVKYSRVYNEDNFVFKTSPGHEDIYLKEEHIVLADEGEDK